MQENNLPNVSIVIIGSNEEANLDACFISVLSADYPFQLLELIYIDSGSIDKSVDIAKKYTKKIFIEPVWPTPARNRNRGLIESKNEYIHFIDGDIILDKDYLKYAINSLQIKGVDCVFGRLEETKVSGIGNILLHDYSNRKEGIIDAPGAGGTFIKKALININGWDERVPRGEESEIGIRLRKAGHKIWFLDKKMGIHDYGISNIFQFFKKQVNEGMSGGAIFRIDSNDRFFKNTRKIITNNFIFHALLFIILTISILNKMTWIIVASIPIYTIYLWIKFRIIRKVRNPNSLKFYFLGGFTKTFVLYGFLKFNLKFIFLPHKIKNQFNERMNLSDTLITSDSTPSI